MQSPEILSFVETCPKGAETLVTRVIHILTDKGWSCVLLVTIDIQVSPDKPRSD